LSSATNFDFTQVDAEFVSEPFSFPDDPGSNNSGYYELQAVLTHRGRSSSSGHYVAWVRGDSPDSWYKCDDDVVSPVTDKEVLKLSGGGKHTLFTQIIRF